MKPSDIRTEDYEKLGAFYLGREHDTTKERSKALGDLVLYDSKDLVTHGVVLGMTGSGKTGLCLSLLEEAAMDGVPAIVIDPKGDIANLMLTFPDFKGADYRPWINEDDARRKGQTPSEFATAQAKMWKNGLKEWGQSGERVRQFREKVDISIYTPGSNAGIPISILSSLEAPPFEIIDDSELFGERIESTVSSLLAMLGIQADPIQSREHILLSNIFAHCWRREESLTLASLIGFIQKPPFTQVGVVVLDEFFPEKSRFTLAMQMNNLLASPGFATWMEGEALDIQRMLYTPEGKPRISIFSIAHLGDAERMFFVSLLLNQSLGWMRSQAGTSSLRALLYMDEIFGYLPPTGNPPSKKPLLTILKQGRAFGFGALLATQNPVDLDYKALSNIGTWFLGRLQTERDKMRVLDGLEGASTSQGGAFDRQKMERTLSGLGNRVFLLNNVHDTAPFTFQVRWVMSYLRGPLTKTQIRTLMKPKKAAIAEAKPAFGETPPPAPEAKRPALPKGVQEYFIRSTHPTSDIVYIPSIFRAAEATIRDPKKKIDGKKKISLYHRLEATTDIIHFEDHHPLQAGMSKLLRSPESTAATYRPLPPIATKAANYKTYGNELIDWFYREGGFQVHHAPDFKLYGTPGESEPDFRARVRDACREERDLQVAKLRIKLDKEIDRAEKRVERAINKMEEQEAQSKRAKMDTMLSIGSAVLGSIFGGRRSGRLTAARGVSRSWKEGRDVSRAEDEVDEYKKELQELEKQAQETIDQLKTDLDAKAEAPLETVKITPYKKNILLKACGLAWLPYRRINEFELEPAFE